MLDRLAQKLARKCFGYIEPEVRRVVREETGISRRCAPIASSDIKFSNAFVEGLDQLLVEAFDDRDDLPE